MSFCDHCQGQRFDRSRVLRALRNVRKEFRSRHRNTQCDAALAAALAAVRKLDIPHLDAEDDLDDEVIH